MSGRRRSRYRSGHASINQSVKCAARRSLGIANFFGSLTKFEDVLLTIVAHFCALRGGGMQEFSMPHNSVSKRRVLSAARLTTVLAAGAGGAFIAPAASAQSVCQILP